MKLLSILLALFAFITTAQAETRYIVDHSKFPLRTGKGTQHKIIAMLSSGKPVELLEQSSDGYSHIRTTSGREGWILSRFLMQQPAARVRLAAAEQSLAAARTIKQQNAALQQQLDSLQQSNASLQQKLQQIRDTAAHAIRLKQANQQLSTQLKQSQRAYATLQQETQEIRSGSQQRWYLIGGGTIVFGILLGLILPRLRVRKRERWGGF